LAAGSTMSSVEETLPVNKITFWDLAQIFFALLPAPVVLAWALLKAPFTPYGRAKSWKRILNDRLMLLIVTGTNRKQTRAIFGPTRTIYDNFMHEAKLTPLVEDIGDDAKLLWIGPKVTDNVLLYFHGGGFLFGMPPPAPKYWRYIQENLEIRGKNVGLAVLNYTLVPDSPFPIQLKQGILAIQHLIEMGVKPENIQILGDSAGGTLIHEIFSHFLHPVEGVPELSLSVPLSGVYMMSPWVRLVDKEKKYLYSNDNKDMVTGDRMNYWGSEVLRNAPNEAIPYLEPNSAPEMWLKGVDRCVKRVLISAGGLECLRDEIIKYQDRFQEHHKDVTFVLQANGIHDDPFWDFATHEKDLGELTPRVLDWLDENCTKRD